MINHRKQQPGKSWTFVYRTTKETDTGILPLVRGENNEFARWKKDHWISRKLELLSHSRTFRGIGPNGLLGRMRILSNVYKNIARNRIQVAPISTPEQMLAQWLAQDGKCAACKEPLVLMDSTGKSACYDHNHETGEPRGFVHQGCNKTEGILLPMSDESFDNLIEWLRAIRAKKAQ